MKVHFLTEFKFDFVFKVDRVIYGTSLYLRFFRIYLGTELFCCCCFPHFAYSSSSLHHGYARCSLQKSIFSLSFKNLTLCTSIPFAFCFMFFVKLNGCLSICLVIILGEYQNAYHISQVYAQFALHTLSQLASPS